MVGFDSAAAAGVVVGGLGSGTTTGGLGSGRSGLGFTTGRATIVISTASNVPSSLVAVMRTRPSAGTLAGAR